MRSRLLLIFFVIFFFTQAYACSQPQTSYYVKCTFKELKALDNNCLDSNCNYTLKEGMLQYPSGNAIAYNNHISFYQIGDRSQAAYAISFLCSENTSDLNTIFAKHIPQDGYGSGFFLEPYTIEKEEQLKQGLDSVNFFICGYTSYERIGNWLIEKERTRNYCQSYGGGGGPCSVTSPSPILFIIGTITNPSINAILAIIPYLLIFGIILLFLNSLHKKKKLKEFLALTDFLIVSAIILAILIFLTISNLELTLLLLAIYYLIYCVLRFTGLKILKKI